MSGNALEVTTRKDGAFTVVCATGEVDLYTSPRLREGVLSALAAPGTAVAVDLSGVPYMDSSGVATLVEGLQASRKSGTRFVLVGLTPRVREVFDLMRLTPHYEIADSLDAARQARG